MSGHVNTRTRRKHKIESASGRKTDKNHKLICRKNHKTHKNLPRDIKIIKICIQNFLHTIAALKHDDAAAIATRHHAKSLLN